MSFEIRRDDYGNLVCDLGVIAHPWPKRSQRSWNVVEEIGPLILVDGITVVGLEEWEWLYESGGFDLQLTKRHDDSRAFVHIHAANGRWTYELHQAHWWDGAPQDAKEVGVYLGVWPD